MTLDLTSPDINPKERAKGNEGKRRVKAKWLNPGLEKFKPKTSRRRWAAKANQGNEAPAAEAQTPRPGADVEDDALVSPEGTGFQEEESNVEAAKVQIMGLHTKNPVVSYKGQAYSCQWASNIGTELLFTEHNLDSQLPVLRNLPGNVDLLAASSTRIISNSVLLEPKPQTKSKSQKGNNMNAKDLTIKIPVRHKASEKQKDQARFLQRLMDIKEAKGEEDEVTIYTQKRLKSGGWKQHLTQKREEERKKLQRIVRANKNAGRVQAAKKRLAELNWEEGKMKEVEQQWLEESRPQGKGRKRVFNNDAPTVEAPRKRARVDEDESPDIVAPGTPYGESMSTPTQQRWEMEEGGEEGLDEGIGDYGEDIFYEEDEYGDEDTAGEDEDTQLAFGWS